MGKYKAKHLIRLIILLAVFQFGTALVYLQVKKIDLTTSILLAQAGIINSTQASDEIINEVIDENKIYGGILPHHLFVEDKIAAYYAGLKDQNYKTIVVISPNHFEVGHSKILLSAVSRQAPDGALEPELDLINKIVASDNKIKIEEQPFETEHGISAHVAFIKKTWPNSKIVPIILSSKTKAAEAENLGIILANNINKNETLVLASVDFSHYQGVAVADFHDQNSQAMINNFDFSRISNLEVDSPASLIATLKYLDLVGAKKSALIFHTNSSALVNKPDAPGTSHSFYYFRAGETKPEKTMSFLFLGDMMLDRYVLGKIKKVGVDNLLKNIAGEENRFFMGQDIVSTNLEGVVTNKGSHYSPNYQNDFAFSPENVAILKKYNFNFFNLANNHLTDQSVKGITETRQNLSNLKVNYSGSADSAVDEYSSYVINIGGQKVAMVGLSMVYHDFDLKKANALIKDLKSKNDKVIVNIHWGSEYQHQFSKKQQAVAYALVDSGADLIIGHHPHVVQGMEVYKNKFIFYSLGNFIFDQYFSADTQEELAIGLNFTGSSTTAYLYPIVSKDMAPELLKGDKKAEFLQKFIKWSSASKEIESQIKQQKINK
jgi:poly-gamma-glutamate synthesis protein (capsule biosynthesis protein)